MIKTSGVRVESDGTTRWVMWGEIDAAVEQRAELGAFTSGQVIIDLTRVTFLDSGGLRLLHRAAAGSPDPVVLVNAPRRVRDLVEIAGMNHLFEYEDTLDGANTRAA